MKLQKRQVIQNEPFFREADNGVKFYYRGFGAPLPVYSQAMALALITMISKDEEESVREKALNELKAYSELLPEATAEDFKDAEKETMALVEDMRRSEKHPTTEAIRPGLSEIVKPLKPTEEDGETEAGKDNGEGEKKGRLLN